MIGAIAGDIIGSIYEFHNIKTTEFALFSPGCRFTDDSVLTIALADTLLNHKDFASTLKEYCLAYPDAGYGERFLNWATSDDREPYHSWGNGAAMRISPVGYAFSTLEETLRQAEKYTAVTHNHPEGIKGAQVTAASIFMARSGSSKEDIRTYVSTTFGYDLSRPLEVIRPAYTYDISCQGTVPQALTAFLESTDFESAIRNAVSLGGDCDTLTCITGGIAQAYYRGVPELIIRRVFEILPAPLKKITHKFTEKYCAGEL